MPAKRPTSHKRSPNRAKAPRTGGTSTTEPFGALMATLNQGLMSLYHASAELQFSKPLNSLLKAILRGLKSGTGISKAAIFVVEDSTGALRGSAALGLNETKTAALEIPLSPEDGADLLKPILSGEGGSSVHRRLSALVQEELGLKNAGLMPLEIRDHLVGLLAYEITPAPLQKEILFIFSRQAALTIENTRLFTKVEEMALKDTLTGLYNRRYFLQILDYELNRAKRYRQPLSLVFIDLDHFKDVNDSFGHSVGDQLLKQAAQKLHSMFRTTDLVARYAGDEFVAILPATPAEGASILANRLQEAFSHFQMMVRGKTLQVSVSIGVDTYWNEEGVGTATFIDRADRAMYEAKLQGRNRVKSYRDLEPSTPITAAS
jgi:diguanylate cyclase (GGDEF)-like protein